MAARRCSPPISLGWVMERAKLRVGKNYITLNAKYCYQCKGARPDDAITMKKDARNQLDLNEAQFSQLELCEAAGITMPTANNWILTGAIRPAHVAGRRTRKPRSFSPLTSTRRRQRRRSRDAGVCRHWQRRQSQGGLRRKGTIGTGPYRNTWRRAVALSMFSGLFFGRISAATGMSGLTLPLTTSCGST